MVAGGEALRRLYCVFARSPRRDRTPLRTGQERRGAPGGGRPRLADLGGELLPGDTLRVPAAAEAGKTARERKTRSPSVVEPFIITAAEARARDAGQQSSDPRLPAPPGLQRAQEAVARVGPAPAPRLREARRQCSLKTPQGRARRRPRRQQGPGHRRHGQQGRSRVDLRGREGGLRHDVHGDQRALARPRGQVPRAHGRPRGDPEEGQGAEVRHCRVGGRLKLAARHGPRLGR
mmetsp:Transcript_10683/g.31496  ORF Transcript_10683/g.31496 Transcript_10683/m.31496 type:complete len:234 (+) Transcript_10683:222-923(+)